MTYLSCICLRRIRREAPWDCGLSQRIGVTLLLPVSMRSLPLCTFSPSLLPLNAILLGYTQPQEEVCERMNSRKGWQVSPAFCRRRYLEHRDRFQGRHPLETAATNSSVDHK